MNIEQDYLQGIFTAAIREVIEIMTGLCIEEDLSQEVCKINKGEISGVMLTLGEKNALVSLTMSKELCSTIIYYMTGIEKSDITEEEIYDGAAELVNMVAGRAKTILAGTKYHFSITPPFTIIGKDHFIVHKDKVLDITKNYIIDDRPLFLQVYYIN
ncbi:chemotaxis protein CheX [Clostridium sp. CS001]|uniref:chemotaxis protein CheX n=1 Tax=Clostridium sp. CS001 TaxID=2880648 RepID=UPI001CF4E932|nr:chemotaxis protein CheX [Clostridium sp. CS001]MCB2291646.1 chemotaxis protein CheX [Clostridium sp. CS001]